MKRPLLIVVLYLIFCTTVFAQTSTKTGIWSDGTVWTGGSVPSGWTTININSPHVVTNSAAHTVQGTINVNSGATLNFGSNVTVSGGSTINVYGTLNITGDLTLNSDIKVFPGGTVIVDGSVTVVSSTYMTVGTNAAGPPYANFVVKKNLISQSSGDIIVEKNGRLAVFQNYSASNSGGTLITVKDDGQVYINGTINFQGGNDHLKNDNNGSPYYGVYSNNQPNYNGQGGSNNSGAAGSNSVQAVSQMPTAFSDWIKTIPGNPLPVKLVYFKVASAKEEGIVLEWATSMEKDFKHFELQRSGSDLQFSTIGILEAKGGLQVKTVYSFLDEKPASGKNYYRLKAVDLDGSTEYFNVIVADWSAAQGLSLYPNPAVNKSFTIDIGDEFDQPVSIVVYEARGYGIYSATLDVRTKVIELPSSTAPGVYLVKVGSSGKSKVVRLVVD